MNKLREGLPELPAMMRHLPISDKGYPILYFVDYLDGKPDFRVMDMVKFVAAVKEHRCWVCGLKLGKLYAFVSGPMCGISTTSAEPPSHAECAIYSAMACPFLTLPKSKRREANLPEGGKSAGDMIKRNPGVALVLLTNKYKPFKVENGWLFEMGRPLKTLWFAEGKPAARPQVLESIASGIHHLEEAAALDGPVAIDLLKKMRADFERKWLPSL